MGRGRSGTVTWDFSDLRDTNPAALEKWRISVEPRLLARLQRRLFLHHERSQVGESVVDVRRRYGGHLFHRRRNRAFHRSRTAGGVNVWADRAYCPPEYSDVVGIRLCRTCTACLLHPVYGSARTHHSPWPQYRLVDPDSVRRTGSIWTTLAAGTSSVGLGSIRSTCLVWLVFNTVVGGRRLPFPQEFNFERENPAGNGRDPVIYDCCHPSIFVGIVAGSRSVVPHGLPRLSVCLSAAITNRSGFS